MKLLILFVVIIHVVDGTYNCAAPNGTAMNDDDYRSYYTCTKYCDSLQFCSKSTEYYSSLERICKDAGGFKWTPAYDITGIQLVTQYGQYRHFQQSGYDVTWSSETKNHLFAFLGRYINETDVIGTETILTFKSKCILVRDVQLTVKATNSFCTTSIANPYSMKCELPVGYAFSGCITY